MISGVICADKETQTDPADFTKLINGQSCQVINDKEEKDDKKKREDKISNVKVINKKAEAL